MSSEVCPRQSNKLNDLRPILAYRELRRLRARHRKIEDAYRELLSDCLRRLREPVEGALTTEISWIQGFTFANGFAAVLELTQAHSAVSEGLDRKSTYALASFSLGAHSPCRLSEEDARHLKDAERIEGSLVSEVRLEVPTR